MVVPVKSPSLHRALTKKVYVRPWRRGAKHAPFIAFYCQGAVSHVGKVKSIDSRVNRQDIVGWLSESEEWAKKDLYTVYRFEFVCPLQNAIARDSGPPIQGKLLVPLKEFVRAKNTSDILLA